MSVSSHPPRIRVLVGQDHPKLGVRGHGFSVEDVKDAASPLQAALALLWREYSLPSTEKRLAERFGLDRSLAGKLIRAHRQSGIGGFILEAPSPEGFSIFLDAVEGERLGGPPVSALRRAVEDWGSFIDRFPEKRRGILGRVAERSTERRDRTELNIRRGLYRHWAELLGYRVRHTVGTLVVLPTGTSERFDAVHVSGKFGLQRTRAKGYPIRVMRVQLGQDAPIARFRPLDPMADGSRPEHCLVPAFCRGPAVVEFVEEAGRAIDVQLPHDAPELNQTIDLVCGQRIPGTLLRRASADHPFEWYSAVPRIPSEALTVDLVMHQSCYHGVTPLVTSGLATVGMPTRPTDPSESPDTVRAGATVETLDRGLDGVGIDGVAGYDELLRYCVRSVGFSPDEFRIIRLSIKYPVLMVAVTLWLPLEA